MNIVKEYSKRIYIAPTNKGIMMCDKEYYDGLKKDNVMNMSEHFVKITIEEDGEKYKMKSLLISKRRSRSSFFRKDVYVGTFSYNRKTKLMYTSGHIKPYGKKKLKGRVRLFNDVSSVLMSMAYRALDTECNFKTPQGVLHKPFYDIYKEIFEEYTYNVFGEKIYRGDHAIFLARLKYYDVKIPDTWQHFTKFSHYLKFKKGEEYKLIDNILDRFNLNFKSIRRIMNGLKFSHPEFHITPTMLISMQKIYFILGKKHFLSLNNEKLFNSLMKNITFFFMHDLSVDACKKFTFSDFERKNIVKIITDSMNTKVSYINILCEYLTVVDSLKEFKHDYKVRATNIEQMNRDNDEYTNILFQLNNGIYHREYPETLHDLFENEIDGYKVVILKNTQEYMEEAMVQRNCLRKYHDERDNFILSIRDENDKRITCEYNIEKDKIERGQTFGFANKPVNMDIHGDILEKIDKLINDYYEKNGLTFKLYQEGIPGYETNTTVDDYFDFMYELPH